MSSSAAISNSEKLENQVIADAEFWLPIITSEDFSWLKEESRSQVKIPKNLNEVWTFDEVTQDILLSA